jgi:hypothetical protein
MALRPRIATAVLAGTLGLLSLPALPSPASVAADPEPRVDVPVADLLDVDFRDGTTTDFAQGLAPTTYGEPALDADLSIGRTVMRFDGTDDALGYPFRAEYAKIAGGVSLECVFRYDGPRTNSSPEGALCSNKEAGGLATVMNQDDIRFMIHVGGAYRTVDFPTPTIGRWYHTLAVWDGSTVTLYVDGEQVAQTAATGALKAPTGNASNMMLAADSNPSNLGQFFGQTTIRAARAYSTALTAEQARALADADAEGPVAPAPDVLDVDFSSGTITEEAQGIEPRTFGDPLVRDDAPMGRKVAQFDGTGSAYLFPFGEQFPKLASRMSVECVFKYDQEFEAGSSEARGNLCGAKESGGFSITMYGDRLSFNPYINGAYRNTNTQIRSGRWYHAVGTYDGTAVRLYVNGVEVATTPVTGTLAPPSSTASRNLVVGGDAGGRNRPAMYSPSTILRAQVWSRALSRNEVLALGHDAFAGVPDDYRVELASSTPAAGDRLTRATRLEVDLTNPEGVGRDVVYALDGDPVVPGQQVGAGLEAGDHVITVDGTDVFGTPIDVEIPFTSAAIPTGGGTETGQGSGVVTLSANATNPSGGDVTTTFTEADVVVAEGGRQGSLDAIPTTRDFAGDGEAPVTGPMQPNDDQVAQSPSSADVPFQQFDVPVAASADQQVVWTGTVDPSREAVLRVWNGQAWEELGRTRGSAEGEVTLSATVTDRHRHGGEVPVLVTGEDPFADDLANEVRDSFEDPSAYDFSLAHVTDTQYLVEGAEEQETAEERAVWRRAYTDTNDWIADNVAARKIAFAAHTGDIIENWHNPTDDRERAIREFEIASEAQARLEASGVPNTVLPGNHDNVYGEDTGADNLYNQYFGPERYDVQEQQPSWQAAQASHEPWKPGDNDNSYSLFTASGLDFVVVSLGFSVTPEEAAWADSVLKQFPDRNAVVLTHAYLTPSTNPDGRGSGFSYDGRQVLDGVIKRNENVALVLSGHEHGVSIEVRKNVGKAGNHVVELLADYQFYKVTSDEVGLTDIGYNGVNTPLQLGSAFFRLLQFDVDAGEMAVDTYSPFLENFGATEYDDRNRYDGTEDDTRLPIQLTSRTTSFGTDALVVVDPTDRVIGTQTVRSGWPATVSWDGLDAGTTYAWRAVSTDAASGAELAGEVSQLSLFTATTGGTDTTAPVITLPAATPLTVGDAFDPLAGVTAVDDVDGDVLGGIEVVGSVDTTTPGSYPLLYVATDANGNQATAARSVEVRRAPAPVNTVAPRVLGNARVGSLVTVDLGQWTNLDGAEVSVQWLRDGARIAGATAGEYRVVAADAGRHLSAVVTATATGHAPVKETTATRAVAKVQPGLTVKLPRATVKLAVRAPLVVSLTAPVARQGWVTVKVDGRDVRTVKVTGGQVRLQLPRLAVGRHTVRAVFQGNDQLTSRWSATKRLTVRR